MNQYKIEIFSCFIRLLSFYSSTLHQTNIEIAQICSKDNLYSHEIQWLHLEVDDHDEEEYSVVFTMRKRLANNLLAQQMHVSFPTGKVLLDELARLRLCGLDLALIRLTKARTFASNATSSNGISMVSCKLLSFSSLLLKSVTNLFKP